MRDPETTGNLFSQIPASLPDERIQTLVQGQKNGSSTRIERILSRGQASPPGFWYDQPQKEWVLVVQGNARLQFADGSLLEMSAGDFVLIDAHRPHRVDWTDPNQTTIWLAVHFDEDA